LPAEFKIGVVGPCAAGKSTLIAGLRERGLQVKHIAQEHSYVKDMWQRLTNPDFLIYLDVSYPIAFIRRQMDWTEKEYLLQVERLRHAREHADFYLQTDEMTAEQVLKEVINRLEKLVGQSPYSGV
jgi:cytidylate kinase